jgi:hypothetical protein
MKKKVTPMTDPQAPKGQDAPERICDYCDETDPEKQAFCYARECGIVVKSPADLLTAAQARAEQATVEVAQLREALEEIAGVGFSEPMTWGGTEGEWERKRANVMQAKARAALREGGKDTAARCAECDCENGGTDCNWIKSDTAQKGGE